MKSIFLVISIVLLFTGFIPYLRDIKNRKVKTQVVSWSGWTLISLLGGIAMLNDTFNWGAIFVLANSLVSFIVVIYALYKKVAVAKTTNYDYLFVLLGIIGLVLWQITGNPDLAIIFVILADLSFGMLTVVKTYRDPLTESKQAWLLAVFSDIFALFALSYISFTEIAYPIFLFLYDFLIFSLVYKIISKSKKESA